MALISAFTLIRTLALFHITLAFYLLTAPRMLADQNLVFLLGESMRPPEATSFDRPTPATALAAAVFVLLGLTDLVAVSMDEPAAVQYWSAQTPIRLIFFFALTGYTYITGADATLKSGKGARVGDGLKNGLVFSWGFLEIMMWFWVFLTIRDQRREAGMRVLRARAATAGDL
ncbi:hypothetical protein EJ06DRAFT_578560 [Trichodelitschia bisporula]|uniref:Increased loss of mitochondrial DNA protein 1 n=1 Tax=Trichodelitschia bisporula TaxID=703511 RepID=A0A6G1IAQ8_9PEZI|nr:hypothetical protein EJ06DRAFT_578560 [Trichodelitschia bisporula]